MYGTLGGGMRRPSGSMRPSTGRMAGGSTVKSERGESYRKRLKKKVTKMAKKFGDAGPGINPPKGGFGGKRKPPTMMG